jgi:membrane protein YqaA with SNARE-associated domain
MQTTPAAPRSRIERLKSFAQGRYGPWVLAASAFSDSCLVPIPADIVLIAMTLAQPRRWWFFALCAGLGSGLGSLAGYALAALLWDQLSPFVFAHLLRAESFDAVREALRGREFWGLFLAGFSPIPYAAFSLSGGIFGFSLVPFALSTTLGRSIRYALIALLFRLFGAPLQATIERHPLRAAVVGVAVLAGAAFLLLR